WINRFALQEGFDYKIRTSEADDNSIIRMAIYMCTKAGQIGHYAKTCKEIE
ncbi:18306_t:CDS:1, partial [Gigaspora rosea]